VERGSVVRGQSPRSPLPTGPAERGAAGRGALALIGTALLFAALGAGGHWWASGMLLPGGAGPAAPAGGSPAATPGRTPLIDTDGTVEVDGGFVELSPKVPGMVAKLLVEESATVAAGAPLLRLDETDAATKEKQARLALEIALEEERFAGDAPAQVDDGRKAAEAEILAQEKSLESLRDKFARVQSLGPELMIPAGLDSLRNTIAAAEQQIEAAKLKLPAFDHVQPGSKIALAKKARELAETRVREAEQFRADHTLRATEAGKVLAVNVGAGSAAGPAAMQGAITFCPARARVVRVEVPQIHADRIQAGQSATILDSAAEKTLARGTVQRISGVIGKRRGGLEARFRNDARTMPCIVAIAAGDDKLFVGQQVRVRVFGADADAKK
jgi:multidrug resistance efflux pump